jgi:AcrR family transcriptional regulator
LLQAAIRLIADVGPAGFTLREVARRAGVSHNAPYRHFPDREDLLAAVAAQGFRELDEAMRAAVRHQRSSVGRLKRAGLAYVEFALRRPEHFTVMFDAAVSNHKTSDSREAAEQAFETLVSLVKSCQDEGRLPRGDLHQFALLAWSMVHGIAKLATAKRLPYESRTDIVKFARFVIDKSLPVQSENRKEVRKRRKSNSS